MDTPGETAFTIEIKPSVEMRKLFRLQCLEDAVTTKLKQLRPTSSPEKNQQTAHEAVWALSQVVDLSFIRIDEASKPVFDPVKDD